MRYEERSTGDARVAEAVKDDVQDVRKVAETKVDELKDQARARARGVREEAERRADRWTTSVGQRAEALVRAMEAASDTLRDEGEGELADAVQGGARRLERMGLYLEDESPSTMFRDVEGSARRHPGAFVGGSFVLGLVVGRFLRSSKRSSSPGEEEEHA